MKNIVFLILFILSAASTCDKKIESSTTYIFEQQYSSSQKAESIKDVYDKLRSYNLDSVPLEKWMVLRLDSSVVQHIATGSLDTMRLIFIYNMFITAVDTTYEFKIRREK